MPPTNWIVPRGTQQHFIPKWANPDPGRAIKFLRTYSETWAVFHRDLIFSHQSPPLATCQANPDPSSASNHLVLHRLDRFPQLCPFLHNASPTPE
jgi:hypothetical protein